MPKLKQPTSLEKIAFDVLLECAVQCCDRISAPKGFSQGYKAYRHRVSGEIIAEGSLDELRQGISVIKDEVCSRLPWHLVADFCIRFLDKFYNESRPETHHEAAVEMIMDTEIVGLKLKGRILDHLNTENAHRFRSLKELELDYYFENNSHPPENINLDNFYLDNLTTLIFPISCTDHHLDIIGRSCPKLKVLRVSNSIVTDEGMRALDPCSELSVVNVVECPQVSHIGLTYLLSANKKLEDFSYGHDVKERIPTFGTENNVLAGLDWSVQCPSMSRFVFENNRDTRLAVDLQAIVEKFPNLTYLRINCMGTENLTPLTSLTKLTGLEVETSVKMLDAVVEQTWDNVKALLTSIGANITTLKLACWIVGAEQDDFNFILEACPNIENLTFHFGGGGLVIPPFRKLKQLQLCVFYGSLGVDPVLKFAENPDCEEFSLETLSLLGFRINLPLIKSIMLDDRFSNLSVVETLHLKIEDLVEIEQIARQNNLNFELKNYRDWEAYHKSTRFYSEDDYFSDFEHQPDSEEQWESDYEDFYPEFLNS